MIRQTDLKKMDLQKGKFRIELAHCLTGLFIQDIYPFKLIQVLFSERTSLDGKFKGLLSLSSEALGS